jgi:hypothetical protein
MTNHATWMAFSPSIRQICQYATKASPLKHSTQATVKITSYSQSPNKLNNCIICSKQRNSVQHIACCMNRQENQFFTISDCWNVMPTSTTAVIRVYTSEQRWTTLLESDVFCSTWHYPWIMLILYLRIIMLFHISLLFSIWSLACHVSSEIKYQMDRAELHCIGQSIYENCIDMG